jgi:spermidine/putrescine-binding protein
LALTAAPAPKPTTCKLLLLNGSDHLDPDLVETFEKRFNVKFRETCFESGDALMAREYHKENAGLHR